MSSLPARCRIVARVVALLIVSVGHAATDAWTGRPLSELLEALRHAGLEMAYSTELVPPGLRITTPPAGRTLREQAESALAAYDLRLTPVARNRFVVARAQPDDRNATAPQAGADDAPQVPLQVAPLDEVLVSAIRDATSSAGAFRLDGRRLQRVPGTESDAFATLRSVPGIAADTSARPYVRGSSQEDVLVIFDHVPIPDPFHLKNFGNLSSVFDVSVIDRLDLYTGGFPARYGTRSGGVVELTPHGVPLGHELTLGAGLSALRVTSTGQAEGSSLEWLGALRRSLAGTNLLAAGEHLRQPDAVDALSRLHWQGRGSRSWTAGLLAFDDSLHSETSSGTERVDVGSRSQTFWLTTETRPDAGWQTRTTLIGSHANSRRSGDALRVGLMSGTLNDQRDLNGLSLQFESLLAGSGGAHWNLGGEIALTSGSARYVRQMNYEPTATQQLGIEQLRNVDVSTSMRSTSEAAFASYGRKLGRHWEFELGLRFDGQRYPGLQSFQEWSPRSSVRYRVGDSLTLHASAGKYTQAQRPDERRFEESQYLPDHPQVQWQESLGADYRRGQGPLWRLDLYHKHWDRVSPYFDNLLNDRGLLPELALLRVRIAPRSARAEGAELSVRSEPERLLQYWASYSWALVQDRVGQSTISRSWDQRSALSSGIDITRHGFSGTAALRWHTGTPSTSVSMVSATGNSDSQLLIGPRNGTRTGDYVSLDLRAAWTHPLRGSDLELWTEVTNSLNRAGNCCSIIGAGAPGTSGLSGGGGGALPRTIDLGVLWRLH